MLAVNNRKIRKIVSGENGLHEAVFCELQPGDDILKKAAPTQERPGQGELGSKTAIF